MEGQGSAGSVRSIYGSLIVVTRCSRRSEMPQRRELWAGQRARRASGKRREGKGEREGAAR